MAPLRLPRYHGSQWLRANLPTEVENWLNGNHHLLRHRQGGSAKARAKLQQTLANHTWQWPRRDICFISDLHADTDALFDALIASGGIEKTGPKDHQFRLTREGEEMLFILGGDFFDKGPGNLRLLRAIHHVANRGARLRILAGNHDIRVLLGMRSAAQYKNSVNDHFFIRMGKKAIPMLREIRDSYLNTSDALRDTPDDATCLRLLLPDSAWQHQFSQQAAAMMPPSAVARELRKVEQKSARFASQCAKAGLSLREVYAACHQWQRLFLQKDGEFHWFFNKMKLACRKGSFLFVHAGVDDHFASLLAQHGVAKLNRQFRHQLKSSPFDCYYGSHANTIRTKYRTDDHQLTRHGSWNLHSVGIHTIVHGHRNLLHGQRIALRKSIVHFECDITLDAHSRSHEGLTGFGGGATLIQPEGRVLGISSDYHRIKLFDIGGTHAA